MALNKQTLSEQIYQILKNDILSQEIPCGSKLTLKMLQERFQVSSTPIREALTRLTQDQLVSYYSNIGVSVVSLDRNDVREIYELIGDFDSLAIRYASQHPNQDAILTELRENLRCCDNCDSDSPDWQKYSDQFHLIFYTYCQNSRLADSAERLRCQLSILAYQYEKQPQTQTNILQEHKKIFQLYEAGKFSEAAAMMKEHLFHSFRYAEKLVLLE